MPQTQRRHVKSYNDDEIHISIFKALKHRLPWLLLGLLGGIFSAQIIEAGFEKVLKDNLILAAFIPLIVYMADAVRTQTESFIIRDSAMHPRMRLPKYFIKQLLIISVISLILSGGLFAFSVYEYSSIKIAATLAISLFMAIISSVTTGLLVPIIVEKLHIDPANVSGPIATIIQDIISITIYFIVASQIL
jgi:magnesium transporter